MLVAAGVQGAAVEAFRAAYHRQVLAEYASDDYRRAALVAQLQREIVARQLLLADIKKWERGDGGPRTRDG